MARLIGRPRIDVKKYGRGGLHLRKWRCAREPSVSQKWVAEQLGYVGHRSIQGYETGRSRLPVDKLVVLARLMGVDPEKLAAPDQVAELRRLLGATERRA